MIIRWVVPVVKAAAAITKNKKIGIFSTTRTASSEYQQKLITEYASDQEVISVGTNSMVPFIEKGDIYSPGFKTILKQELKPFISAEVDTVALGCTHFPFITTQIQEVLGKHVTLLDPGAAVARHVERILNHNNLLSDKKEGRVEYFVTGDPKQFENFAQTVMKEDISVFQIQIEA
jgi:glutamate racemase